MWKCHHCNKSWSEWNHTKAVRHVTGDGKDIAACKSVPHHWRNIYKSFMQKKQSQQASRENEVEKLSVSLGAKEAVAMSVISITKEAMLASRNPRKNPVSIDDASVLENASVMSSLTKSYSYGSVQKKKKLHQQNLMTWQGKNPPEAERQLSLAINHFAAANVLPLSISECPLLNRMLVYARNTNNMYKPPKKDEMSGSLLEANYVAYHTNAMTRLMTNVDVFGMAIYGDGATIVKVPMINILASSAGNPNCIVDVIDCSEHMSEGGKKDAFYICQQILPQMRVLDPQRQYFDLIAFDGASNVQKTGKMIEQFFPRCSVITGIEHTTSLLFGKVMSLWPIKGMCLFAKKVSVVLICFIHIKI